MCFVVFASLQLVSPAGLGLFGFPKERVSIPAHVNLQSSCIRLYWNSPDIAHGIYIQMDWEIPCIDEAVVPSFARCAVRIQAEDHRRATTQRE
jgi:hypothetical protein